MIDAVVDDIRFHFQSVFLMIMSLCCCLVDYIYNIRNVTAATNLLKNTEPKSGEMDDDAYVIDACVVDNGSADDGDVGRLWR